MGSKGKVIPFRPKGSAKAARKGRKVLIGDFSTRKYDALALWLGKEEIDCETVTEFSDFLDKVALAKYDCVVVNLLWGGKGPGALMEAILSRCGNVRPKIIVVSRQVHRVNIQKTLSAGADDFVAEPFETEGLFHRVIYHLTPKTEVGNLSYNEPMQLKKHDEFVQLILESVELLSNTKRHDTHASFLIITQRVGELLSSNRTSLILVDAENESGVVLASSDDPKFSDFPISLKNYPEILHVMNIGKIVCVGDVTKNVLTQQINKKVRSIKIGSVMVFPVRYQGDIVGVLTVRRPDASEIPSNDVLKSVQVLANILAAHSNTKFILRKIYREYPETGEKEAK